MSQPSHAHLLPISIWWNPFSTLCFACLSTIVLWLISPQPEVFGFALKAFLLGGLCSSCINLFVRKAGILAVPVARSSHVVPTPLGGGVGIFLSFTLLVIVYLLCWADFNILSDEKTLFLLNKNIALLCLALGMGFMGVLDDTHHLGWYVRIGLQFSFACTFLFHDPLPFLSELHIPFLGVVSLGWAQWILAILWMVGFTNLINFMDGLNGFVTGYTIIVLLGIVGVIGVSDYIGLETFALVGCILGFFIYNFPQARLFLGDAGSQFLGFFLGGFALIIPAATHNKIPLLAIPLLFWPFINDGLWTFGRRIYFKRLIYDSHRDYLFHLLNQMGYSHRRISSLYFSFALIQVGWLYILRQIDYTYHLVLFIPNIILYGCIGYFIVRIAKSRGIPI